MSLLARLLIGLAGTGLAVALTCYVPIPRRWVPFLDAHPVVDHGLLVGLLTLNVSGWIVALAVGP